MQSADIGLSRGSGMNMSLINFSTHRSTVLTYNMNVKDLFRLIVIKLFCVYNLLIKAISHHTIIGCVWYG